MSEKYILLFIQQRYEALPNGDAYAKSHPYTGNG